MTQNLRKLPETIDADSSAEILAVNPDLPVLQTQLHWEGRGIWDEASACNGCGACRTQSAGLRMCPTFRARQVEVASPRAQANVLRQIASGAIDPRLWGGEELKRNADLCIHCNACVLECPSAIDVSSLMMEAKAAYVRNHGLSQSDWVLSRLELWSRIASRFPILSNALLGSRPTRWLLERSIGLSRHRRIPKAHRTPFVGRAERLGLTKSKPQESGPRVVYFVDVFANYFDQELAESVVSVLRHAGVNVYVPRRQRGSGMASMVVGDFDHARELALRNLRVLSSAIRDGYTVVTSEPTAALMLRNYYERLTDDLDAELVAKNTMDVGDYLLGLHRRGQLPEPDHPFRARFGYHQPCHLKSLEVGAPGVELMRLIPELDLQVIDRGCSGMAGTFGLARRNFRTSLRAGRGLIHRLREDDIEFGATECGACRIQMEQGVAKRTLHPMKVLSVSYGLNPALQARLRAPKSKRALS